MPNYMKRKILYVLAFLAVLILGTLWIASPSQSPTKSPELIPKDDLREESANSTIIDTPATAGTPAILNLEEESENSIPEEAEVLSSINLSVDGKIYETRVGEGSTVMDAMQKIAGESKLTFETRIFPGIGEFVESINGKKEGDGFHWFLYINGMSSTVGASEVVLSPGDEIEWRFKKME